MENSKKTVNNTDSVQYDNSQDTAIQDAESGRREYATDSYQPTETNRNAYLAQHDNPQRTNDEEEKLEKKRKRQAVMSAISDGIGALSNLYFTTQEGLDAYDPKNSLSEANKKRWDEFNKDYDKKLKAYQEGLYNAGKLDADENKRVLDALRHRDKMDMGYAGIDSNEKIASERNKLTKSEGDKNRENREKIASERNKLTKSEGKKNRATGGATATREPKTYDIKINDRIVKIPASRINEITAGSMVQLMNPETATKIEELLAQANSPDSKAKALIAIGREVETNEALQKWIMELADTNENDEDEDFERYRE